MKKIIAIVFLTLALVAGTAVVVMVHPQPAYADGGGCSGNGC